MAESGGHSSDQTVTECNAITGTLTGMSVKAWVCVQDKENHNTERFTRALELISHIKYGLKQSCDLQASLNQEKAE